MWKATIQASGLADTLTTRMGILSPLAERYVHRYVLSRFFKLGIFIDSGTIAIVVFS